MQQINFAGSVTILPDEISDKIFNERSLEAKAVAIASIQSNVMQDEEALKEVISSLCNSTEEIKRLKTWHAYHINIESIEFWLGNQNRFHNRLRYDLIDRIWHHKRLQP